MGQLKQKLLGQLPTDGSFLETQDYSYNIRGWLKGINKDYANNDNSHGGNSRWFGMEMSYDWGFDSSLLNGNIAGTKWRSKGDAVQRAYGFSYDAINRFLAADFNQYSGSAWDRTAGIDFSAVMGDGMNPTTAYDENGNILRMLQSGWQLGGSHPIDSLQYTYYDHTNKLKNVIDGRNDTLTTMGDFRTSSLSPYKTGKTIAATDYVYDVNGNMTRDLNKDIGSQTADGIAYNHLNLPWQIKVRSATGTKGTITYIYDATGNKLEKRTMDSVGNVQTHTTYMGSFQYQGKSPYAGSSPADTLLFFGDEEGRVRVTTDTTSGQPLTSFKYDYFIKDHLGNTRMVLTDEQESDKYIAVTMEVADSTLENLYYSNLSRTRTDLPAGYPTDTTTNPNNKVARLNGGSSEPKIGPGITLKVMAGDQFSIRVSSWYRLNGATPGSPANPLNDLLASLISGVGNLPGGGHPSMATLQANSAPLSDNITEFLSDTGSSINSSKPHAFVNWVLFDNQFNYVAESSGFDQVGGDQEFKKHTLVNLPVTKSGYLYIYLNNETPNIDVFFDNLQVTHTRGPLTEEDHYYPGGLTMAGISDKALKTQYTENKYRFNFGSELQNKEFSDGSGLELYDAHHRMYDPQIGRFGQIDPLGDATPYYSPYCFASNNPITHIDPFGLKDTVVTTKTTNLAPAYVYGHKSTPNNWLGWPSSTGSERRTWARNQGLYYDRLNRNQPLSQKGDPSSYTASLNMYKRWTKAENEGRAMQAWAVGIIAAPALVATAPAELGLALRMKVGFNVGAFAVDAGLQTVANAMEHKNIFTNYNFLSGGTALLIGAPEGASLSNIVGVNLVTATAGSSVNLSINGIRTGDIFSFNPVSILIGTVFGSAAGKVSQALGGGGTMDALVSPVNFTGTAVDEGTKPKDQ